MTNGIPVFRHLSHGPLLRPAVPLVTGRLTPPLPSLYHGSMTKRHRAWLWIFVAFTALGALNAMHFTLDDLARGHHGTWPVRAVEEFTGAYAALALLPFIIWVVRRFSFRKNWPLAVLVNAVTAVLYSLAHTTILYVVREAAFAALHLGAYDYGNLLFRYPMEMAGDLIDYAILIGIISLFDATAAARNAELAQAELNAKLADAKLENLQLQLQPHFLFNTLNAISSVMYEDVAKADKMLVQVSDFMRLVLASGGVQAVPLDEELHIERTYVDIMKTRLERNLDLEVRIADGARSTLVPFMLLQPLIENSIKHGMGSARGSLDLTIDVSRCDGATIIAVSDNGIGYDTQSAWGIGLRNTASRLEYMYGDRASFTIEPAAAGGTVATVRLPLQKGAS